MTPTSAAYLAGWLAGVNRLPLPADAAYAFAVGFKTGAAQRKAAESNAAIPRAWRVCAECPATIGPNTTTDRCRKCYWRGVKRAKRAATS